MVEPWPSDPTDEATDEAGPPLSVWLAVGLLVGPPTTLLVWLFAEGSCGACVVLFFLPYIWLPVPALVRRNAGGAIVAGLLGLMVFVIALVLTLSELSRGRVSVNRGLAQAGVLCWSGALVGLTWWPATRRWCGILPQAEPDDE